MSDPKYTPDELWAQIEKMHPRVGYKDQPTNDEWLLQVGIGAGMLSVAAKRIEDLEAAIRHAQDFLSGEFYAEAMGVLDDATAQPAANRGAET